MHLVRAVLIAWAALGCSRTDGSSTTTAPSSSASSSSSPSTTARAPVPPVVCPAGTERETNSSAAGVETFCVRIVPCSIPDCDVGPAHIRNGPYVALFPDGSLRATGAFANDARVGAWLYARADGSKLAEGSHDDSGRRQGAWTEWRLAGKLRTEATFVAGRREGAWRNVWGDIVVGEGRFTDDVAAGAWTSHFCAGGVHLKITLAAGKLDGPCERFDVDGTKLLEGGYRADKKNGAWRVLYKNGTRFESTWKDGARDGPWRWLGPDGRVVMEGALASGALVGRWIVRDATGNVSQEGTYERGALVNGTDVTTVPKLNGYESNAYCTQSGQGFSPQPTGGEPSESNDGDLAKSLCATF